MVWTRVVRFLCAGMPWSACGTAEVDASSDADVKPLVTRTEEEIGVELAALWKTVSKLASSLMWRTGQFDDLPVPQVVEEEAVGEVVLELAVPSDEASSFWSGEHDMTSGAATAVAKPVDDARPPGLAKR